MLLYRNTKVKANSPDADTDYFDVAGVLQEDKLTPYLFIICLEFVLRTSVDKMKVEDPQAQTITNADYADDIALLANTPSQAKTQLHSLESAA